MTSFSSFRSSGISVLQMIYFGNHLNFTYTSNMYKINSVDCRFTEKVRTAWGGGPSETNLTACLLSAVISPIFRQAPVNGVVRKPGHKETCGGDTSACWYFGPVFSLSAARSLGGLFSMRWVNAANSFMLLSV